MTDESPPPSLEELDQKLAKLKAAQEAAQHEGGPHASSYGMRAGMDLVSGVAVGTGVGYALDAWLETLPWFSLLFFLVGLAAGVKLMMETSARAARALEEEEQRNKR